ncbi:MAG: oxygen-binding di-iron domain-containing protein [Planctomycetota bacterium]|jgi:flavorubredoxin
MGVTNKQAGTCVDEVADGIYRISTSVSEVAGGFSFNQYLLTDEQPLLFHTGPRRMCSLVQEAISSVLDVKDLRFIGFSHYESDECGALGEFLSLAPSAVPLCSQVNAMINGDCFDKPARVLSDGETLSLGSHRVRWFDTPHLPHAWECGYLMEETTSTLLCGDLFTQGGAGLPPLTSSDILESSEAFRKQMDYYSHAKNVRSLMAGLETAKPTTLACMHGSAWRGDGSRLLSALAESLDA